MHPKVVVFDRRDIVSVLCQDSLNDRSHVSEHNIDVI